MRGPASQIQSLLLWSGIPPLVCFFMYVYAACACRTFSGSSLPSVHYPIFCPLTSLFFRPVCLSELRSHIRPPLGILECFLLRRFVIHHPPPQSIYIHARLSVHVLYSRHHATKVPTTPASDDLDLCFPDDAGGDPVEPRGQSSHRQRCNWICRVDSKGQDQISRTNQRSLTRGAFFSA